jgi:D-amino-acid oxidase
VWALFVVVGAGVIGLSAAHELAVAGPAVRVVADRDALRSVSGAAAAIWCPHDVKLSGQVWDSAGVTFRRLVDLANDAATGVRMRKVPRVATSSRGRSRRHHHSAPCGVGH